MNFHPPVLKISLGILFSSAFAFGLDYPSMKQPGDPIVRVDQKTKQAVLSNGVVGAKWDFSKGKLQLSEVKSEGGWLNMGESASLFRIATNQEKTEIQQPKDPFMAVELKEDKINLLLSSDGESWQVVSSQPRSDELKGSPVFVRIGKMSSEGTDQDFPGAPGDMGDVRFDDFSLRDEKGEVCQQDSFVTKNLSKEWTGKWGNKASKESPIHLDGSLLSITTDANRAAFVERAWDKSAIRAQVRVGKGSDRGDSWGPGIALVWENGQVVLFNKRVAADSYTIKVPKNGKLAENIVHSKLDNYPNLNLNSSDFVLEQAPQSYKILSKDNNSRTSVKIPGKGISAILKHKKSGLRVKWNAELRENSGYIRQTYQIIAGEKPVELAGIELFSAKLAQPQIAGSVPGSPVIDFASKIFVGVELPVTLARLNDKEIRLGFACSLPMQPKSSHTFSTVIGTFPEGQERRAFLHYLECERAMPYTQFLHYNSWYQTGLNPRQEALIPIAQAYKKELVEKRNVRLDSFVIDDGWDNPKLGLWQPDPKKFPRGFGTTTQVIREVPSNFGIWISPLGGYYQTEERKNWARQMNVLPEGASFDLSYPNYYNWFKDRCSELMTKDGVNYFKWDKAGEGVSPHFMALLSVANDLRKVNPKLFINTTVGTWPSPFWLNHVDCTWRSGSADVGWAGKGDKRESWITYRDGWAKKLIVDKAPFYPLNSLMHHGLVLGTEFQAKTVSQAGNNLKNDSRIFFASGANLQELYLSPDMMNDAAWDDVAAGAKWAQKHAKRLVDVHWVGGDPLQGEVYGFASWDKDGQTLGLRNPDDKPHSITLNSKHVFNAIPGSSKSFSLKSAYTDQRVKTLDLTDDVPITIELQPFEVLVFE